MLLAAQSMAVGTVLMPWVGRQCDPVMATGWHMVLGGLPLAALSAVQEGADLQQRLPLLTGAPKQAALPAARGAALTAAISGCATWPRAGLCQRVSLEA